MRDLYVEKVTKDRRRDNIAAALGALIVFVLIVVPAFLPAV